MNSYLPSQHHKLSIYSQLQFDLQYIEANLNYEESAFLSLTTVRSGVMGVGF